MSSPLQPQWARCPLPEVPRTEFACERGQHDKSSFPAEPRSAHKQTFDSLLYLTDVAKILVSLGLIAPLAFFMGMPFPLGLSRVWSGARALVPWAWGVNGCASVLSAILATLIAMTLGFSTVVLVASLLYAGAAAVFYRPLKVAGGQSGNGSYTKSL